MHGAFWSTPSPKVIVHTASAIRSGVHQDELGRANRPDGPPSPTVSPATAGSSSDIVRGSRCGPVTVGIISYRLTWEPGEVTHSLPTCSAPHPRVPLCNPAAVS